MAFKLIGDGAYTSSVAITTLNIATGYPAIPFPHAKVPRAAVLETSSGYRHGYRLGGMRRQWPLSLKLMSFSDYRNLMDIFDSMGGDNWVFWEQYGGTVDSGDTTHIADTVTSGTPEAQNGWFNKQIGIVTDTTDELAPEGEVSRVTVYTFAAGTGSWAFDPAFTVAPGAGDTYVIGWPVVLMGEVQRSTPDGTLWNVEFTFEERLMSGVG